MDIQKNQSLLIMREELIKRKRKMERYGKIGVYGMVIGVLPLMKLFSISEVNISVITSPWIWGGLILMAFSYTYNKVYYEKAKERFKALKEELINQIRYDYCLTCEEREKFLKETKEKYDINLYWK
ncbi:hypothetical protein BBF96_02985 [Anoxybacter fermentans]|uniref:DUF4231 domain-containing protein n=1 Tax=Anoxybacter fermentans TaxID=1323375 RepID=A0A3S9SVY5_9FIRM|nr:DUF2663 family protein [Anoxybacter fermentans]AZR72444.1 hypothetical protein BBF96_02985 [Anoxybacter fermentans]